MPRWFTRRRQHTSDADAEWARLSADVVRAKAARVQQLAGKESLVAEIEALLFRHDPIGINFEVNTDEYRAEAETITIRLPEATDEPTLLRIIHEEFVRWFGASVAGTTERYDTVAEEIWQLQRP